MKLDLSKILLDREKQNQGKPLYRVTAGHSRSQTPDDLKSKQKLKEKGLISGYVANASKFNSVVKSKIDISE